jgi:glucokinase
MKLGIDCGGTKTEAIVLNKNKIIEHILINKPSTKKNLFSLINRIISKYKINFIGIGFPSPICKGKTTIVNNIPEWNNTNIKELVLKRFNIPCKVDNDANCFALAESHIHENKGYKCIVGVTLGTGLGCGIIINKKIINGITGSTGEINKIPYKGKTLEDFTSKKFFTKFKKEPIHVLRKAELCEKIAIKQVKEYSKNLGIMLSIIINTINPNCIVFGGNISNSFNVFKKEMLKELKKHIYPDAFNKTIIKKSNLKYSACIGAIKLKE